MLQVFREKVMGWLGWIVIGLIIVTFALFGLGSYIQNKTRVYAARVNDVEITPQEAQFAYQQQRFRMEQMLGEQFDPALIDNSALRRNALDTLINRSLLQQAAQNNGMGISDQLLAASIQAMPVLQENGEFSKQRYEAFLRQQGYTPAGFEAQMRGSLAAEQLVNGLSNSAFVTQDELQRAYALQEQKRDFSYLIIAAAPFEDSVEVSDAEIESYYRDNEQQFMVPERVKLEYVRLDDAQLKAAIEIDEQDLQDYYEQRKQALKGDEQRRASHILLQVEEGDDEAAVEEAREKASDLTAKIREGADFAELAREHSEDTGSADSGGDLGYFARGAMAPAFEEQVFSMEEGAVSEPVRTPFGFHIIKLTGIQAPEIPELDEVKETLIEELKSQRVDDLYYERVETLADLVYESPDSLDAATDELGLEVQTTDWLSAAGGDGIGQFPKVVAAAFSDDVLEAGNNSEPLEVGERDVIVVRVAERQPAHLAALEEVKARIEKQLIADKAAAAARARGEEYLQQLNQGATLDSLSGEAGELKSAEGVTRSTPEHPGEIVKHAFRLEAPQQDAAVNQGFSLNNGDYVVLALSAVHDVNGTQMKAETGEQLQRGYLSMRRSLATSVLLENLRARAEIEIPEDEEEE